MRPIKQALLDHELIVLRVIGEWWELDLTGADKAACVKAVADVLTGLDLVQERQFLAPEEMDALDDLIAHGGKIPVSTFARTHGEVRMMGPARLEREEPWFEPESAAEALWYRGFMFQGFDETAEGLIEFYYLPEELLAQFPQKKAVKPAPQSDTIISPVEAPALVPTAVSNAVDDLTTLLALAQQTSLQADKLDQLDRLLINSDSSRRSLLVNLAREMGMLRETDGGVRPTRTAVEWLQQSREQQLRTLADAWSASSWNELRRTPGLLCEGEQWQNDPISARSALLDVLPRTTDWYRLTDLIAHIRETDPDFQRPDGDYETWYIRDQLSGDYITGFDNWNRVEGRLLAFLVQGPLQWLGLAIHVITVNGTLYQLTDRALEWLQSVPASPDEVRVPLVIQSDAVLIAPHNADRYQRFQAARISEPDRVMPGQPFQYRLTAQSLARAKEEGITPERVLQFLEAATGRPVPPGVKRGINRWADRGVEGRLETAVILRVREPAILDTLRNNPKTRDFIGESLGEMSATVRPGQWEALRDAVAQLGLLLETNV
jgi:hypothetical protein